MLGSNLSACQVSTKGRSGGERYLAFSLFYPLEKKGDKSRGVGGRAPDSSLPTTFNGYC